MKINSLSFQVRVQSLLYKLFGVEVADDPQGRNQRFLEEALELVQACDMPRDVAHKLVDFVYDRPKGEVPQEIGGVMVTFAALCNVLDRNMGRCGETELTRVEGKSILEMQERQNNKPVY